MYIQCPFDSQQGLYAGLGLFWQKILRSRNLFMPLTGTAHLRQSLRYPWLQKNIPSEKLLSSSSNLTSLKRQSVVLFLLDAIYSTSYKHLFYYIDNKTYCHSRILQTWVNIHMFSSSITIPSVLTSLAIFSISSKQHLWSLSLMRPLCYTLLNCQFHHQKTGHNTDII